jgi:hypothetical protein
MYIAMDSRPEQGSKLLTCVYHNSDNPYVEEEALE